MAKQRNATTSTTHYSNSYHYYYCFKIFTEVETGTDLPRRLRQVSLASKVAWRTNTDGGQFYRVPCYRNLEPKVTNSPTLAQLHQSIY